MKKAVLVILMTVLACGIFAQDLIILKNGNEIKAKVLEITRTEIKYKRYDNLNGPILTVSVDSVSAIKYENGTWEDIDARTKAAETQSYAMNPQKLIFGIYANPIGFLTLGPMAGLELTYGYFSAELNVRFPTLGLLMPIIHDSRYDNTITEGIGVGCGIKFFLPSSIGGFYIGGFAEFGGYTASYDDNSGYDKVDTVIVALNIGYKFVFKSGLYIRLGGYVGAAFSEDDWHSAYAYSVTKTKNTTAGYLLDLALGFNFNQ